MGKTFKDQRSWERHQNGKRPSRDQFDEESSRKNRHYKFDDVLLEDEDLDDYEEYNFDYYE